MRDQGCKIRNCTLINNGLSEFFSVLSNFTKSSGTDSLKSELWLLNAEDEKPYCSCINYGLG
jgi:hypothetical protein